MKPHVCVIPLLALSVLSGCFLSAEPRIKTGVMLAPGPVAFCTPDEPPCRTGYPSGDGYVIASEEDDEEDLHLRFEALTEAAGVPVYLGEAELRDGDGSAWSYIVARPATASVDGAPRFEIAMPSCSDLDKTRDDRFGIVRTDAYSCTVTDLAGLRELLITDYAEELADPAWWSDENQR